MYQKCRITAILAAGGAGTRFGADHPKQYTKLGEVSMLGLSLSRLLDEEVVDAAVVAVPQGLVEASVQTLAQDFVGSFRALPEGGGASDAGSGGAPSGAGKASFSKTFVDKKDKLYEQCEALETFLLKTLINGMRKTVEKSDFSKGGFAGEMYEDMLYDEYAKDFSRNAGFGLAELAYLELSGQRGKLMAGQRVEG
jgi:UDP-N-acetylglucosamine pyrophosphorylase